MAELQLDDIQGNLLAGFNTNVEILIGLTADQARVRDVAAWLVTLATEVTTVAEVREQRRAIKAPLLGGSTSSTWLCVSIGPELLATLRPDIVFLDDGFFRGFVKRAKGVLEDRTDPATWRVGGPANRLDVFLIVASNEEATALGRSDALVAQASAAGLTCTYRETARRIEDLEHFGFRDGVSQPKVRGFDPDGTEAPGHFVFGYERFPGESSYVPAKDPRHFLRNGSFLVFRRLAQDVGMFRSFCARKATELVAVLPGMTDKHLAALLVGRWPTGALVSMDISTDPGRVPNENGFDFGDDPSGLKCPFGAHIRKVNPRAGPKDVVDTPRILRRGIPFGPTYDMDPNAERGLAFISFQTSIEGQLELLTGGWMNSPARPAPGAGHDLLVGRSRGARAMTLPGSRGKVTVSDDGLQWITPTGGGYLFAPGRSALARMAEPLAPGFAWRAQRLFSQAKGLLRDMVGE